MNDHPLSFREKAARWALGGMAAMQLGAAQPVPERMNLQQRSTEIQASQNEAVENLRDIDEAAKRMNEQQQAPRVDHVAAAPPDPKREALQQAKRQYEKGRAETRSAPDHSPAPERRRER